MSPSKFSKGTISQVRISVRVESLPRPSSLSPCFDTPLCLHPLLIFGSERPEAVTLLNALVLQTSIDEGGEFTAFTWCCACSCSLSLSDQGPLLRFLEEMKVTLKLNAHATKMVIQPIDGAPR